MKEQTYKPLMPDLMEAIFDAGYLIFDLVAGILFFAYAGGNSLFVLYGILTLTLCGGDAFHLGTENHTGCTRKQRENQKTDGKRPADFLCYDDSVLHYPDVRLESDVSGAGGTACRRGYGMDFGNRAHPCLPAAAKQLVYR